MSKLVTCLVSIALLLPAGVGALSQAELKRMPGYVSLERVQIPQDAGKVTVVDLDSTLLQLAAAATEEDAEGMDRLLGKLHSIRVKVFEVGEQHQDELAPVVADIEQQLERGGWQQLIRVKDTNERVLVSIKQADGLIRGLMVVAVEPDEAAFVNIVGELEPRELVGLLGGLDDLDFEQLKTLLEQRTAGDGEQD